MALVETPHGRMARSSPGFAYLMTGIALACIVVSGVLGSIFTPDMVTSPQHDQFPIAAVTGWIWPLIGIGLLVPAAVQGIRTEVTDHAPWIMLGLGVGAIWLATMFVAIFTPVLVTGTDPTELPIAGLISAIAAVVLTGILCNFVKTTSFQPSSSVTGSATIRPRVGRESVADDAMDKLRRLAQLRESSAITEAEFEEKKNDLLSRI